MTVRHGRHWRYIALAAALLLPLLACLLLTWAGAQRLNLKQAQTEASISRNHIERILREAWAAVDAMGPLLSEPCEDAQPVLSRIISMRSYFRALALFDGRQVYCSTLITLPRGTVYQWPADIPTGRWLRLVGGTPLMQGRPALLAGAAGPGERHAMAVIDSQHLQDLLDSVASLNQHHIELKIDGGMMLTSRPAQDPPMAPDGAVSARESFTSEGVPVIIEVSLPGAEVREEWRSLLLVFLPVALVLGCLMAWGVHRLQMQRLSFRDQMQRGMRAGEFHMEYQPIFGIASGRCEGAEALMRWERPGMGAVSPEVFIAAAEAEGIIVALTRHALRLIERDLPLMTLPPGFHLSVNVAADHLRRDDFIDDIETFAARVAPSAPQLVLELTERSLVEDSGRVQLHLRSLRAAGVRIAIDDFGAGYCSLSYLQQFPVDYLKIDKLFIEAITGSEPETPVLDLILALARRLDLAVVAEGVSEQAQLDYLRAHEVTYAQGFLVSRPLRAEAFAQWYRVRGQAPLA
ncbi:hypothetical protein AW878_13875 [Bordetella pseudohinzii]|uniref:cyclic-guanylate-specific phosphodiesterase n=1 Tax=Bordetella pseudohinzii TaxID=1331258 RepID=A0ABM6DKP8_9BORD|nr:EAL domain-containing protein [Bordetella pseudohinzii]ANY18282.1 hypothetical protein BBN53_10260 [Bordetella pseudohinzii]KMM25257.1 hypothetical protein L540_20525 [Bordetella pseudohinzii]KXA76140.1 hypothetical protein AW877_17755 [Bordetella pseudohinzii]KXA78019.1 hypothetical protein AW878_13875 [Bordetella pseudohinzii]